MKSSTTRVSTKGQVVLPVWVRDALRLRPGDPLRVELSPRRDGTILLRRLSRADLERLLEDGYHWIEEAGADPVEELHEARRRARANEVGRTRRRNRPRAT